MDAMSDDVYSIRVAGTSFYQNNIDNIEIGDDCILVPEPDNKHDQNALLVMCRSEPIGYIPKDYAPLLSEAMICGNVIATVIGKGRPKGSNYIGVSLSVRCAFITQS